MIAAITCQNKKFVYDILFGANAETEFKLLQGYVTGDVKRKKDESDKVGQ